MLLLLAGSVTLGRCLMSPCIKWIWPSSLHASFVNGFDCNSTVLGFPGGSDGKESACNTGDSGSTPWSGRSPGEGNGYPIQCSCQENPMDRGAWWATFASLGSQNVKHNWTTITDKIGRSINEALLESSSAFTKFWQLTELLHLVEDSLVRTELPWPLLHHL